MLLGEEGKAISRKFGEISLVKLEQSTMSEMLFRFYSVGQWQSISILK